jgi:hypothetical protein
MCRKQYISGEIIACKPQLIPSRLLQIFLLMNLIIEKLGDTVKPCAGRLLQMVHDTYSDPKSHSVLRIQVRPLSNINTQEK